MELVCLKDGTWMLLGRGELRREGNCSFFVLSSGALRPGDGRLTSLALVDIPVVEFHLP